MEYKIREILKTEDYEFESDELVTSFISSIVKVNDVLGFIYSFFNNWENRDFKRNIVPTESKILLYHDYRNPELFNKITNEIILTDREIEVINNEYFSEMLDKKYNHFFSHLDFFNRHFRGKRDFSLFETYTMLLNSLNTTESIFSNGSIENPSSLNINLFRDKILNKNLMLRNDLKDKISLLDFPQQNNNQNGLLPNRSSADILVLLLNSKQAVEKFKNYESKLMRHQFLSDNRNKWLKNATELIQFYSFCERKSLFKDKYETNTNGIKLLRELYDFHSETSMDTPSKRKIKSHYTDLAFLEV